MNPQMYVVLSALNSLKNTCVVVLSWKHALEW